ncbi:ent-kaurenoic acid oxidase 1-like isoform X3 [Solanum dulcamara]|uniref:ent-kaurenoic acid oxidase 1-like isoform X3 n=1 Tax=Solanum dulcamara TaxID=45834 RepID=UPI0024858BD9|nr:ent-kaurenoic acid oxidase 1-like isoform X3 [Solanum dulcamara]
MEYYHLAFFYTALAIGILTLYGILKRANGWYYAIKFCSKKYNIPPGDMGWPFVGNTLFYFKCSMMGDPGSFLSYFVTRFGPGGMYKGYIFGKPSIIVTKPEIITKILMDEENLDRGLPNYMKKLVGLTTTFKEDKCIRRLIAPIKGQRLLSNFIECIDRIVKTTFEKYAATEEPIEFLSKMKKLTFEVFMRILVGGEVNQELFDEVFKESTFLNCGIISLPINIQGFAYNRAIQEEQEDIVKSRPSSNVGLNFDEIRRMKYLSKVINETLRIASNQTVFLKDTNTPYNINGYTIPKGWRFFANLWNIHMDPNTFVKPQEFNPSRWDDLETKPGTFLPFGMGPRGCPGSNLARLEISVILHYFLLYYRVEQINPEIKTHPPENYLVRFKKLSVCTNCNLF